MLVPVNKPSKAPSMVIFDFDGTLFDTRQSISHCIIATFKAIEGRVPDNKIMGQVISSGVGLEDAFRMLNQWDSDHPVPNQWITTYRELYAEQGIPLLKPFNGAEQILAFLREKKESVVIVTNKGVKSVETALEQAKLDGMVDLIVGDVPGVPRKPNPACFNDFILTNPLFAEIDLEDRGRVFVVGDTAADIKFAANIGARSVWAKYGYGDMEECMSLKPYLVISDLSELQTYLLQAL